MEVVEFLKNQTCGYQGLEPFVCCYKEHDVGYPKPPDVPHPRMERCMTSSEENGPPFKPDENEIKPKYYGHHAPHDYPRFFPPRGDFHHHRSMNGHPPKHMWPPSTNEHFPNDIPQEITSSSSSTSTARTSTESTVVRSRLLPDQTCGLSLDQRIVGGKTVKLGSYPWIARLGYTRKLFDFLINVMILNFLLKNSARPAILQKV